MEIIKKIDNVFFKTKAKLMSQKLVYKDNFLKIIKETYNLPNNRIITKDRIVKNNNKSSVIIIAKTMNNKYLIVIQNRVDNIISVEFPSGYIEEKESVTDAAKRELLEETGYTTNNIILLDSYYTQLGIESSIGNIVIADNCIKTDKQNLSNNEYINYLEVTFKELKILFNSKYINGVGNKLAYYILLNKSNK